FWFAAVSGRFSSCNTRIARLLSRTRQGTGIGPPGLFPLFMELRKRSVDLVPRNFLRKSGFHFSWNCSRSFPLFVESRKRSVDLVRRNLLRKSGFHFSWNC